MKIWNYDDASAKDIHSNTIRGYDVFPQEQGAMKTPFENHWGYLPGPGALEVHAHPSDEIYMVFEGNGTVMVGGETAKVKAGDVIEIPGGMPHNIANDGPGKLIWAAFWWAPIK